MRVPEVSIDRLPNGLTVVAERRPASPVAGFFLFYRVGSRNERPGQTGLSHFLEHMCFKDGPEFPWKRHEIALYRLGATLNAFTSWDTTCYWEVLPAEQLETAVAIEAERMGKVQFDPDLAIRERTIIVAEREGGENNPGYLLHEAMMQAAFQQHPYGHMVIGSKDDIRAVTAESLAAHYATHYRPDNAVALVLGDLPAGRVADMAGRHFGRWGAGGPVAQDVPEEPPQAAQRRIEQRRPAPVPEGGVLFRVPPASHPDTVPLAVLAALLGGVQPGWGAQGAALGRSSRLHRALVLAGLAARVAVSHHAMRDAGLFSVDVTGRPDSDMGRVEAVIWQELGRVAGTPPPPGELERAVAQVRARHLYGLDSTLGHALGLGWTIIAHEEVEAAVAQHRRFLDDLAAVTPADVQRVAAACLRPEQAVVGWLYPTEAPAPVVAAPAPAPAPAPAAAPAPTPAAASEPQAGPGPAAEPRAELRVVTEAPSRAAPVEDWGIRAGLAVMAPGDRQPAAIRAARAQRRPLPGGTLLVYPMDGVESVVARAWVAGAGAAADPEGQDGLARLTAAVLTRGFGGRDPRALEDRLDTTGTSLRAEAGTEGTALHLRCLTGHLDEGLDLLAQALIAPDFPEQELEQARQQQLTAIRQAEASTAAMAAQRLAELMYPGGHPFRRRSLGRTETVQALGRDALVQLHARRYPAGHLIVVMAGRVDADRAAGQLAAALAGRAGGEQAPAAPVAARPGAGRTDVAIPGKSQSDIAMGFLTVDRHHPDWLGLRILAAVLGQGMMSRLFRGVRERLGLSYSQHAALASTALGPGAWSVHVGCATRNVPVAVAALEHELALLSAEPVPADELAAVRDRLLNSQTVGLETPDAVAGQILEMERLGLGLDYLERYPDLLAGWGPAELQAAARRHLDVTGLVIAVAGPPQTA